MDTDENILYKVLSLWSKYGSIGLARRVKRRLVGKRHRMLPVVKQIYVRNKSYSDADIYKVIYVNPNDITYETLTKIGHRLNDAGAVYAGLWDKARARFHCRYKVRSLRRHFNDGIPWTKTEYYKRKKAVVSDGKWRGCSSEKELLAFFERIDKLYEEIQHKGYKTQEELLQRYPEKTTRLNNDAPSPRLNEIGINIGRNGSLLWQYGGQHRLAIAQVLGLDEVPVQVLTRHRKWQNLREDIDSADTKEDLKQEAKCYYDHPDMQDIIN